jgi:NAD-dependent deacetylase
MHQDFFPPGIVVPTGAGISKESGIDTLRDPDGLWNRQKEGARFLQRSAHSVSRDPGRAQRRARRTDPPRGEVRRRRHDRDPEHDPLHEMAGSKNVIHMHGRAGEVRCMKCSTVFPSDTDLSRQSVCPTCRTVGELRPNIVWFGEEPMHLDGVYAALAKCGPFLAIGTSGEVYPAAGFVLHVRRRARARTVELNLEPTGNQPLFQEHIYGPATRIVPPHVERILAGEAI